MRFLTLKKISSAEAWKVRAILFGFIVFGLLSSIFYPLDLIRNFSPGFFRDESSCIMLNVFGIPCPFCGMSHAFAEFIKFNFAKSIYYNPSSVIFFSFLGITCFSIFVLSLFNYKISVTFGKKTFIAAMLVLSVIWILNILFGHLHDLNLN